LTIQLLDDAGPFRRAQLFIAHSHTLVPGDFTMPVAWIKDVDAALAQAKQQNKPVLLDFSAAPM
jgi:uncharacterized protein YyaL (SSP411 family)